MKTRLKFGKKLRALRKKHGITQEALAETAGIDYKHLQKLESKTPSAATIDTLEKLAAAFKISISKLLDI